MTKFNNSNQYNKILYRFSSYKKNVYALLKTGVPLMEILKTKFPYYLRDNWRPCSLSIEFGNTCNLNCVYCNVPQYKDRREFMSSKVFSSLILNLKKENIARIRIGGGEPTLHPDFNYFVSELRKYTNFLSIVTNMQWKGNEIAGLLVNIPINLIEVSMDAGGKEIYEKSRIGANYELFETNLIYLKKLKDKLNRRIMINMRLMIRPSTKIFIKEEQKKWKKYCDSVMPQYILKIPETLYKEDVFSPVQKEQNDYPNCTLPFKDLLIKLNGEIPFCQVTGSAIDRKMIIAGNIFDNSISEIWNNKIIALRNAHRQRCFNSIETEYCMGCSGR